METLEWRWIGADKEKKEGWPSGPWLEEPDKRQWQDPETGLPCLIVRNPIGALCGYVGVAEGHPLFGLDYMRVYVNVHGGLTFSGACQESSPAESSICHVVAGDEKVWWLGFDTAHLGDLIPGMPNHRWWDEYYRDLRYVEMQVKSLAKQIAKKEYGVSDEPWIIEEEDEEEGET